MNGKRFLAQPFGSAGGAWLALVAAVVLVAGAWRAPAQSTRDVRLLTSREQQRLSPEARAAYEAGVKSLDKINPITAITQLDQAAQLAPESLELQFLVARLAHLRARRFLDAEAEKYYAIAERALERISKKPNITPLEQRRYEVQMKEITDERQKLELRKQKRMAVGIEFRKAYAKERYIDPEKRAKEKEREARQQRRAAAQQERGQVSLPGAVPPPPVPGAGGGAIVQPPGGGMVTGSEYDS